MGSSMQNEPKRYFAAIRLGDDVPPDQLGRRVEGLRQLVSNFAKGDVQLAFSSGDERFVGMFFQTARDIQIIRGRSLSACALPSWGALHRVSSCPSPRKVAILLSA